MVKQGNSSAICELDLSGLEDFVTVLSATTDNVALLDSIRELKGDDPDRRGFRCSWMRFVERKSNPQRSTP